MAWAGREACAGASGILAWNRDGAHAGSEHVREERPSGFHLTPGSSGPGRDRSACGTRWQGALRKHKCFLCSPFYGRACRWAMLGELKSKGPKGARSECGRALRKDAGLCCGSRLRKGEVFAYVGLPQNLKDLKGVQQGRCKGGMREEAEKGGLSPPFPHPHGEA